MDYTPLKAPIQTDPLGLGFAPLLTSGNFNGIAAICNTPSGKGVGTVTLPTMINSDFALAFTPFLLNIEKVASGNPLRERTYDRLWQAILSMPTINVADQRVQNFLLLAESDGLLTPAQASGLNQRQGTYAEVICGPGASPNGSDISALFFPPTGP